MVQATSFYAVVSDMMLGCNVQADHDVDMASFSKLFHIQPQHLHTIQMHGQLIFCQSHTACTASGMRPAASYLNCTVVAKVLHLSHIHCNMLAVNVPSSSPNEDSKVSAIMYSRCSRVLVFRYSSCAILIT